VFDVSTNSAIYSWVILPALIFCMRVCDVSISTVRIILVMRGKRKHAAVLGFFEVLVWLLAITLIIQNLKNLACYLGYAGGYAAGVYVGMHIENKMALGMQIVRIITRRDASSLIAYLKAEGYGVTTLDGQGAMGPVKVIFTIIKRKDVEHLFEGIRRFNPQAMVSVEDVRFAEQALLRKSPPLLNFNFLNRLKVERRGK
jgi:uncharacterized protein YebE (UPF0316 family)